LAVFIQDGHPPQGLSEARWGKKVAENVVTDPPRGRPFRGGGVHLLGAREILLSIMENSMVFARPGANSYRCHSIKTV